MSGGGDTCSDDHPVPSPSHVKSELQRVLQKYGFPLPKYTPLPSKGPSHRPSLSVKLTIMSQENSIVWEEIGEGRTKKEAEVYVAARALQYVKEETRVGLFHPSLLVNTNHLDNYSNHSFTSGLRVDASIFLVLHYIISVTGRLF